MITIADLYDVSRSIQKLYKNMMDIELEKGTDCNEFKEQVKILIYSIDAENRMYDKLSLKVSQNFGEIVEKNDITLQKQYERISNEEQYLEFVDKRQVLRRTATRLERNILKKSNIDYGNITYMGMGLFLKSKSMDEDIRSNQTMFLDYLNIVHLIKYDNDKTINKIYRANSKYEVAFFDDNIEALLLKYNFDFKNIEMKKYKDFIIPKMNDALFEYGVQSLISDIIQEKIVDMLELTEEDLKEEYNYEYLYMQDYYYLQTYFEINNKEFLENLRKGFISKKQLEDSSIITLLDEVIDSKTKTQKCDKKIVKKM